MIRCIEKLKLRDGVGGRALDSSWTVIFNEKREEDWSRQVKKKHSRQRQQQEQRKGFAGGICPVLGERPGQLEGSTMDKARE